MLTELTTPRLVLRELAAEHEAALQSLQNARRDDPARSGISEFEAVASRIASYEKFRGPVDSRRIMSYVAEKDGQPIGTVSLSRMRHLDIGSISVFVGDAFQRRGYAIEMVERMVRFGFQDCRLHRIEADVEIGNIAGLCVMERVGMVREGVMRDCTFAGGRWWSDAKYAALAAEWNARRGARRPAAFSYRGGLRGGPN